MVINKTIKMKQLVSKLKKLLNFYKRKKISSLLLQRLIAQEMPKNVLEIFAYQEFIKQWNWIILTIKVYRFDKFDKSKNLPYNPQARWGIKTYFQLHIDYEKYIRSNSLSAANYVLKEPKRIVYFFINAERL